MLASMIGMVFAFTLQLLFFSFFKFSRQPFTYHGNDSEYAGLLIVATVVKRLPVS